MRLRLILYLLLTLFFAREGLCQGTWSIDSTNGFYPVSFAGSCVLRGKIYVIAGAASPFWNIYTDSVQIFDPITHIWSHGPSFPSEQYALSCDTFNGKIFAFGGGEGDSNGNYSNRLEIFDPSVGTWSDEPKLQNSIGGFASCEVNGKIFLIGGDSNGVNYPINSVQVFDPPNDTWRNASPMPNAGTWLTSSALNGKIYVMGGFYYSKNVYVFDPSANEWSVGPSLPIAIRDCTSSVVDGKIYVVSENHIEVLDPETNSWSTGPDFVSPRDALEGMISQTINGKIYALGGENSDGDATLINEAFTPEPLDVTVSQSSNSAHSLQIFPNPASSMLQIRGGQAGSLHIFDFIDREVLSTAIQTQGEYAIDISSLENGMYILRLGSESEKIEIIR